MNLELEQSRVIVTGSTRGIGLSVATAFLEEGARVLLNGLDRNRLDAVAVRLRVAYPDQIDALACDVSTAAGAAALFTRADGFVGGVDVLVNNAGVYHHGSRFHEVEDEAWDEVCRTNLQSVRFCSREAVRRMIPQKAGVILNAASFAATVPSVEAGAYAAVKAAVLSLTRTMAAELAPHGIRVNAYVPGVIATDMTAALRSRTDRKTREQIALQRFGTPEEVAGPVVFLASKPASYITGTTLEISGGKLSVQRPEVAW
jgi:3-oxoacyl-[acyl-carrier protein] reductase